MRSAFLTLVLAAVASAHIVITYPGWRENNLHTNEDFPYGMQWIYPCGGSTLSKNRTYWPTTGGAVAFQPGWFRGHELANIQINMGFGDRGFDGGPENMSNPMVKAFQIQGPTNNPYPGTVCLPQVPLPVNATVKAGDNATIQVVEQAQHGAALYSCVDITFVDPGDDRLNEVNETNCFNTTDIGFAQIYAITIKPIGSKEYVNPSGATQALTRMSWIGWLPLLSAGLWVLL